MAQSINNRASEVQNAKETTDLEVNTKNVVNDLNEASCRDNSSTLEAAFSSKNEVYCRYLFNTRLQEEGESAEDFVSALVSLARLCNYGAQRDSLVRDRVVVGVRQERTRNRLLQEVSLTLEQCVDICRQDETAAWMAEMAQRETPGRSVDAYLHPRDVNFSLHGDLACQVDGKKISAGCTEDVSPQQQCRKDCPKAGRSSGELQNQSVESSRCAARGRKRKSCTPRQRRRRVKVKQGEPSIAGEIMPSDARETTLDRTVKTGIPKKMQRTHRGAAASADGEKNSSADTDNCLQDVKPDISHISSKRKVKSQSFEGFEMEYVRGPGLTRTDRSKPCENPGDKAESSCLEGKSDKEARTFSCHVCARSFSCASSLSKHKRVHFGKAVRGPQSCPFCAKVFKTRSVLKVHLRSHTGERPYTCEICGMRFKRKDGLNGHMETHTGQKKCECEYCGRSFMRPEYLNSHRRLHTGEKKYACHLCGKRFHLSGGLLIHMRYHSNERPYVCEECGKAYVKLSHLKVHCATKHTTECMLSCSHCPKMFKTRQQLMRHERLHSGVKQFICEVCGAGFVRSTYLTQHMKSHRRHQTSCPSPRKRASASKPSCQEQNGSADVPQVPQTEPGASEQPSLNCPDQHRIIPTVSGEKPSEVPQQELDLVLSSSDSPVMPPTFLQPPSLSGRGPVLLSSVADDSVRRVPCFSGDGGTASQLAVQMGTGLPSLPSPAPGFPHLVHTEVSPAAELSPSVTPPFPPQLPPLAPTDNAGAPGFPPPSNYGYSWPQPSSR